MPPLTLTAMESPTKIVKSRKRSRTAMSCDVCKSRKTKCSNPVPGPCDYCKTTGAACHIDVGKRKQRPYYFVSEEEYRHMAKILKHYHPDQQLDLKTLRTLAAQIDQQSQSSFTHRPSTDSPESSSRAATAPVSLEADSLGSSKVPYQLDLEELADLHEQLGCLLRDSAGEYRYTAASSGIGYNAAVREIEEGFSLVRMDQDIIPPLRTTALPPRSPEVTSPRTSVTDTCLPQHEVCFQRASRFLREVHSLFWLYPSEEFHARLDACFSNPDDPVSASWLCSLYSILAISSGEDETESSRYLALAKSLVSAVFDEADLDSVRAFILLALALQSQCYFNSAYLYAGSAVQTAFTLGLHVDKYSITHGLVQKEQARRVWWTLYIFDQDISLRSGKPVSIPEEVVKRAPPLPSEQILSPGPCTPNDYLRVSVSLSKLTKAVGDVIYARSKASNERLTWSEVASLLTSLREWQSDLPAWLKHSEASPPCYQRAVGILFARYCSTYILATRPFLMASVLYKDKFKDSAKLRLYENISRMCIENAEKSLQNLDSMYKSNSLTGLIITDFNCIFEIIQVLALAFQQLREEKFANSLRRCVLLLQSLPRIGWCKKAIPEVMAQLARAGVVQEDEVLVDETDTATAVASYPLHRRYSQASTFNEIDWSSSEFGDPFTFGVGMDEQFTPSELMQQVSSMMPLNSLYEGGDYVNGTGHYGYSMPMN